MIIDLWPIAAALAANALIGKQIRRPVFAWSNRVVAWIYCTHLVYVPCPTNPIYITVWNSIRMYCVRSMTKWRKGQTGPPPSSEHIANQQTPTQQHQWSDQLFFSSFFSIILYLSTPRPPDCGILSQAWPYSRPVARTRPLQGICCGLSGCSKASLWCLEPYQTATNERKKKHNTTM